MLGFSPQACLDPRRQVVQEATLLLRIPEFAFFRLAYQRYYGRFATDRELEPDFMGYLLSGRVPPWVRHLARDVHARHADGQTLPQVYGIDPVLPPLPRRSTERRRGLCLALVYAACFMLFTVCAL